MTLIDVRGVTRTYGDRTALNEVSVKVGRGVRLGIVGESGSGKSTLVKLIMGLDCPSSGTVTVASGVTMQMVFQDPASSLNPWMTVHSIVAESLSGNRRTKARRVAEVLAAVGLPDAGDKYPHQFSGGQRQRISIARAIASRPTILVADEAVSALDVSVQAQILNVLSTMTAQNDLTLIVVSHDIDVVRWLCDEVIVMQGGCVVEAGSAATVLSNPQHEYTRALISAS